MPQGHRDDGPGFQYEDKRPWWRPWHKAHNVFMARDINTQWVLVILSLIIGVYNALG